MIWKDPQKELPPENSKIAVLSYHWKKSWPLSAEIIFGEVESYTTEDGKRLSRVNTCDMTGAGSYCWYFHDDSGEKTIAAWCYASEFKKPPFLEHNEHHGQLPAEQQNQED